MPLVWISALIATQEVTSGGKHVGRGRESEMERPDSVFS